MAESSQSKLGIVVPVVVVIIAAVGLGFALTRAGGDDETTSSSGQVQDEEAQQAADAIERRDDDDPMAMGAADAPVVLVNYSDFQCPFCGKFARDSHEKLVDKYVKDGTLRIEWRDFPYLGEDSRKAAKAGRAAAEQGKFWEFHDAYYADQPKSNSGQLTGDFLTGIANEVGLDVKKFHADRKSNKFDESIDEDFNEGQAIGVTGTPTFVINGIPIVGAQPLNTFADVIENEAREAP